MSHHPKAHLVQNDDVPPTLVLGNSDVRELIIRRHRVDVVTFHSRMQLFLQLHCAQSHNHAYVIEYRYAQIARHQLRAVDRFSGGFLGAFRSHGRHLDAGVPSTITTSSALYAIADNVSNNMQKYTMKKSSRRT